MSGNPDMVWLFWQRALATGAAELHMPFRPEDEPVRYYADNGKLITAYRSALRGAGIDPDLIAAEAFK